MCNKEKYINIQNGKELDLNEIIHLPDNALIKHKPELWNEWDFEKNNKLELDIYKVTKGSQKKAWWICLKCKSNYDANFNNRFNNNKCPYCAGKKTNHTNSLAALLPDVAKQWHPNKNGDLTPFDVTKSSNKKVWWICNKGHDWNASVNDRANGNGCSYCSCQKVLKGFNDIWTTNPKLASLLANPEDGYMYMQNSHTKLNWKCPNCGEIIESKEIRSVNANNLLCQHCSSGKSYSERIIRELLKEIKVSFKSEVKFKWSDGKRYDFEFKYENKDCLIEINGSQHSIDRGFESVGGRTIEEEIENDKLKERLARDNGINYYIIIDARYSEFEYIKNNIINSELSKLFNLDNVDWVGIQKSAESSIVKLVCDLWMNNCKSVKKISEKTNLNRNTVARYLRRGSKLSWCDYVVLNGCESSKKKVVGISMNDGSVVKFNSITEASMSNDDFDRSTIARVCNGVYKSHRNYKWMFLEEYENKCTKGEYNYDK